MATLPLPTGFFRGHRNLHDELSATINTVYDLAAGSASPNQELISVKADFPAPIAGVINLDPSKIYKIAGVIDLGSDVLSGSFVFLLGDGSFGTAITTNSASPLVTADGTGGYCIITGMGLTNNGAGGVFDVDIAPAVAPGVFALSNSNLQSAAAIGTIRSTQVTVFSDIGLIGLSGVTITGAVQRLSSSGAIYQSIPAAPAHIAIRINATATLTAGNIHNSVFDITNASDIGISIDNSATLVRPLLISNCIFGTVGTPIDPAGMTKADKGVIVADCVGQESSLFGARASYFGNTDVTTFTDTSYVGIGNGTPAHTLMTLNSTSERFLLSGATADVQIFTYDGLEDHVFEVGGSVSAVRASGTSNIFFAMFLNGVKIDDSERFFEVNARTKPLTIKTRVTLSPGDTIQLKVSHAVTTNVTLENASMDINRLT